MMAAIEWNVTDPAPVKPPAPQRPSDCRALMRCSTCVLNMAAIFPDPLVFQFQEGPQGHLVAEIPVMKWLAVA
jgi:hypothetical protein